MSYVVYEVDSGLQVWDSKNGYYKSYKTEAAAEACRTRLVRKQGYQYCELAVCALDRMPKRTRVVHNLMTGKPVEIDVNTPLCCDPSSETYWSM
jgi:hypothetical protein|nr:hypothetical protein [Oxalobacteraceae bacterium]